MMTFPPVVYTVEELVGKESDFPGPRRDLSSSNEDDDSAMVTLMEDFAAEYMWIAPDITCEDLSQSPLPEESACEVQETDSFVLVSLDDVDYISPSWWQSIRFHASRTARSRLKWAGSFWTYDISRFFMAQPKHSRIHESYDWVSDTNVQGGRLILPGQLISLDENPCNSLYDDRKMASGMFPSAASSTIMVSAHDLLSCHASGNGSNDEVRVRNTSTMNLSQTILHIARRRVSSLASSIGGEIVQSYTMLSARLQSLTCMGGNETRLAMNTAEWINRVLELYHPPDVADQGAESKSGDYDSIPISAAVHIELSTMDEASMAESSRLYPKTNMSYP